MPLATLDQLKERLRDVNPAFQADDGFLSSALDRATATIESMLGGRKLTETAHTEYVDGDGSMYLNLKEGPIVSVASVDQVTYSGGSESYSSLTEKQHFFIRGLRADGWLMPGHLEAVGTPWTEDQRNYRVVYTAGWTSTAMHDALVEACLYAAAWYWNTRKYPAESQTEIGDGIRQHRRLSVLKRDLREIIAPFTPTPQRVMG